MTEPKPDEVLRYASLAKNRRPEPSECVETTPRPCVVQGSVNISLREWSAVARSEQEARFPGDVLAQGTGKLLREVYYANGVGCFRLMCFLVFIKLPNFLCRADLTFMDFGFVGDGGTSAFFGLLGGDLVL